MSEAYIVPNTTGPTVAIDIDADLCIGCGRCADICRIQTILPNPEKGGVPIVAYPDECWYCGCCVGVCPTGALQMRLPINQRVMFKDKESGEIFRIGAADAPKKTFFKAPYGWVDYPELGKIMKALEKNNVHVAIDISPQVGVNIGRFFGEKTKTDSTGKLVKMLKKVGFDEVNVGIEEIKITFDSEETMTIGINQLSVLLHRLCVSNYTAVKVWREL